MNPDQRPWLSHYDPGVPTSLQPYPQTTLLALLEDAARQRPDHPAVWFKGRTLSLRQLLGLIDSFAAALSDLGLRQGDRLAILLPNCPQFLIAEFAAHRLGAIAAPLNPLYKGRELERALDEIAARHAIVLTLYYPRLKTVQAQTPVTTTIAVNIKEFFPAGLRWLFTLFRERQEGHRIQLAAGDYWMAELLRRWRGKPPPQVSVQPGDPAILLFSGGTTGVPKAALGSHQALVMSGMQIYTWFRPVLEEWQDVVMANLPFFHVYAQAGILPVSIVGHGPLALVANPRDLDDLLATIERTRAAYLPGVPTLFTALSNHPRVRSGKANLSSLKLSVSGAAPLLAETKARFEAVTAGVIVEGFGMTESMMAAIINPLQGGAPPGSIGLPLPDVEVRIVDLESGTQDLPAGALGEVLLRAPQLMSAYWNQPQETAVTLRAGWLYTGDIGYIDADGFVFLVDRKKDLIKVSGFQVWPREVEEVLASHPAVKEVGVTGVADEHQGEAVAAYVVLHADTCVTAEELRLFCRQNLAGYKVPRQVEFRQELPKSLIGKVLRRQLAEQTVTQPAAGG